jgi:hypothetical protein
VGSIQWKLARSSPLPASPPPPRSPDEPPEAPELPPPPVAVEPAVAPEAPLEPPLEPPEAPPREGSPDDCFFSESPHAPSAGATITITVHVKPIKLLARVTMPGGYHESVYDLAHWTVMRPASPEHMHVLSGPHGSFCGPLQKQEQSTVAQLSGYSRHWYMWVPLDSEGSV